MDISIIEKFATENKIPKSIVERFLNEALEKASLEVYPNRKLFFDISSKKFYELVDGSFNENEFNIIGRKVFILTNSIFKETLNKFDPIKFKMSEKKQDANDNSVHHWFNDNSVEGPYCSACHQAPCLCSDREQTSNVHDF